ncbi:RRQRL motif-containing zinc-binding protein [Streptomyces justiciae]|uniref:RRQRL motif-containing zinc-binding protein n=1 Tax=Streptomyces justiciae TaxID=2780140 RepID=A0ABU3LUL9_9ACTN|nr:RRQRL motif-containing zinc-binding protein [Streptomyces justiciae]MDT7842501.1 RRQRL motif-containing zinc-binding protein [Streptomyces justiciae]
MPTAYAKCFDPTGARYGIPTYPWRMAPDGYATRRQLRARGLRPGGQPIAAQLMLVNRRQGTPRVAYLYRVDRAKLVRPMTSRKWGALALAMLARRTCPRCGVTYSYCLSTRHGICGLCLAAEEQRTAA